MGLPLGCDFMVRPFSRRDALPSEDDRLPLVEQLLLSRFIAKLKVSSDGSLVTVLEAVLSDLTCWKADLTEMADSSELWPACSSASLLAADSLVMVDDGDDLPKGNV